MGVRSLWRAPQENPHSHLMPIQQQHPGGVSGSPSVQLSSPMTPFYTQYASQPESVTSPRVQQQHSGMDGHGLLHGSTWTSLLSFKPNPGSSNAPNLLDKPLVTTGTVQQQHQHQHQQHHYHQPQPQHQHQYQHQQRQQQQQQQQQSLNMHSNSSFALWEASSQHEKVASIPVPPMTPTPVIESGCKIFGVSLTDTLGCPKPSKHILHMDNVITSHALHMDNVVSTDTIQVDNAVTAHDLHVDNVVKAHGNLHAQVNEPEPHRPVKSDATSTEQNVGESRSCLSTRSRIKVIT